MKNTLEKKSFEWHNKKYYLLGCDSDNINYYLESPSWDCDWYWGFGYVETFANNINPHLSKDIDSHSHIDSSFMGNVQFYNFEKKGWDYKYIHNIYDSKLEKTTFTEEEGWRLSELFKQFYLLREMAEFCYKDLPGCNITSSPVNHGNMKDLYNEINKKMIPKITSKIIEILS